MILHRKESAIIGKGYIIDAVTEKHGTILHRDPDLIHRSHHSVVITELHLLHAFLLRFFSKVLGRGDLEVFIAAFHRPDCDITAEVFHQ